MSERTWQYRTRAIDIRDGIDSVLNMHDEEGWELVSMWPLQGEPRRLFECVQRRRFHRVSGPELMKMNLEFTPLHDKVAGSYGKP